MKPKEMNNLKNANYIVWISYGYGEWNAYGYQTLKEAVNHEAYGSEKIITGPIVQYEITEVNEKE